MADIQTGRFGPLVQALFNLKQRLTLGQVFPDVMPVLDLEQPRPEMEIFSGNDLFWGYHLQAPVAAENSQALFAMPAAAGRLAVIEEIIISNTSGATAEYLINTSTGGTAGATVAGTTRDTRRNVVASTMRVTLGTSPIPSTTAYRQIVVPNNTAVRVLDRPLVLAPRGASNANLLVQCQTVNLSMRVNLAWRERILGSQETSAFV